MALWKIDGALQKSEGHHRRDVSSYWGFEMPLYTDLIRLIRMLLYPARTSNLEKSLCCANFFKFGS